MLIGSLLLLMAGALYWKFGMLHINGVTITKDVSWRTVINDDADRIRRDEIRSETENLLMLSRYDELEEKANQYRTLRKQFKNGEWELNAFYAGLTHYLLQKSGVQENWEIRIDKLREWVRSRPNSVTARVALSECLVGYAFAGRGYGYANTVSDQQRELFAQRITEAQNVLFERSDMRDQCPQWRAAMMRFHGEAWTKEKFLDTFSEAFTFNPEFAMYYFRTAVVLLPRWYGDDGDMEEFCTDVANHVGGTRGDIIYAQIIWFLDYYLGTNNLREKNPRLDWRRVKRGIESIPD